MQLGNYRPVFSQLVDTLILDILEGSISSGDKLPAINDLSLSMKINPRIVQRAYRALEELGVVRKVKGVGLCVTTNAVEILQAHERDRFLRLDLPELARRMRLLDIDPVTLDWNADLAADKK